REAESGGSRRQSAGLTNSQRIEATRSGEQAKLCKAQYLHGRSRRKSDRHKREGECVIPGEIWWFALRLPSSRGEGKNHQKSAAGICRLRKRLKAQTGNTGVGQQISMRVREAEAYASKAGAEVDGRNLSRAVIGAETRTATGGETKPEAA